MHIFCVRIEDFFILRKEFGGLFNMTEVLIEIVNGDTFTPVSLFQRLSGAKKFLFESSFKHEDSGRYSFLGVNPSFEIISNQQEGRVIYQDGRKETFSGNVFQKIREYLPQRPIKTELPIPFISGGIGYVGYDTIRLFEDIGTELPNTMDMPEVHLMFFEEMIVFDHMEQKVFLVGSPLLEETSHDKLKRKMLNLKKHIQTSKSENSIQPVTFSSFTSEVEKEDFIKRIEIAKKYIRNGDVFQVVLSQRMKAQFEGDPFDFYRYLRIKNPSPYMYFIDYGTSVIAGTSPESLIKVKGSQVITNPIAGTKKRGATKEEDIEIEMALKQDEKELAEHKMLVDLGRNDLGRICEFGSIQLDKYMQIEKYQYVMHLVSEVSGRLKSDYHALDALVACLPAGTVSGAPKIRAMQLINELEISKRGVYSGAIGYISINGNLDFALAIRTMVLKDGFAYIQAGAGIVYDSIPEQEYQETLNKLRAFLEVRP
jgi:anthranilate synthase component I